MSDGYIISSVWMQDSVKFHSAEITYLLETHFNYSPWLYYSASMNEKFQTHWALSPIEVFGAFWTKYCIILQLCKDVSYITRCKYLTFNVLEIALVIENECKIMSLLSELISIETFNLFLHLTLEFWCLRLIDKHLNVLFYFGETNMYFLIHWVFMNCFNSSKAHIHYEWIGSTAIVLHSCGKKLRNNIE